MSSFFRNKSGLEFQLNGSYSRKESDTVQDGNADSAGSQSTCYENLVSHDGGRGVKGESVSPTDPIEEDLTAAMSYENVCAAKDPESDDYLEPECDVESIVSEDYLEPDDEMPQKQETKAQIHSVTAPDSGMGRTESHYALPKKKTQAGHGESSEEGLVRVQEERCLPAMTQGPEIKDVWHKAHAFARFSKYIGWFCAVRLVNLLLISQLVLRAMCAYEFLTKASMKQINEKR
uniref:uncharacterized protein n=1 Tax=Pristiophorus japonicus TaxID=55135 RepID=UPI00398E8F63